MPIIWRDAMSVDHGVIDDDHKVLVKKVNEFEALISGDFTQKQLMKVLLDLKSYTESHFAREEQMMDKVGFMGASEHRALHRCLIEELNDQARPFLTGEPSQEMMEVYAEGIAQFLRHWLVDHIIKQDLQMKPLFQASKRVVGA
ncbi:MAG: bacteriohemerythrin [Magnetovibrionaceae bacterium]